MNDEYLFKQVMMEDYMRRRMQFVLLLILTVALALPACDGGSDGDGTVDSVITRTGISGVTPPAYGESPVTTITETDQYTGTVSWSPDDNTFEAETVYTATITLTSMAEYTLSGVAEDFFTVAGATLISNDADSGVVTAEFPATGEVPPAVINISAISGITLPSYAETPVTTITETDQYTGTVSWLPDDATFACGTIYIATITLTAKSGYTLTGVDAYYFNVDGALSVSNAADSGVVTAIFPATSQAVIDISAIPGVTPPVSGETPVATITETAQYTGTVSWSPLDNPFAATKVYTATITLTAKSKYTLSGVAANYFTVAGARIVMNDADSGSVTAEFEETFIPPAPGDTETFTADAVSFTLAYVPRGLTFPTGTNDDGTSTVANNYWIGETEVTYELWSTVYEWAVNGTVGSATGEGQYTFANMGTMGDGSGNTNQHPVTTVNWRDSMVWCNALTEWYNAQKGTNYECVYSYSSLIIRGSSDSNDTACDGAVASSTAKGFRLLSNNEWECAARYRGTHTSNVVTGTIGGTDFSEMATKWTKGNSASGATTYHDDVTNAPNYAGKLANDAVAVYLLYYDEFNNWVRTGVSSTAAVKSKTTGYNSLGLYDMSGNVIEWCFDLSGAGPNRISRGGSWRSTSFLLQVGIWSYGSPSNRDSGVGFRFGRTQ